MKALLIVDRLDEVTESGMGFGQGPVVFQIDLLAFQGFEEALGLGILVRVAGGRHADLGTDRTQSLDRGLAGIVDTAISVMDQARGGLAQRDRLLHGRQGQRGIDAARQLPSDAAP